MPPSTAAVEAAEPALLLLLLPATMPPITAAAPSTWRVIALRRASASAVEFLVRILAPVRVRVVHALAEIGVVLVERVDQRVVALTHALHALDDRVILRGQAHQRIGALARVTRQVGLEGVRREVTGEAQARDLVNLHALVARQLLARGEQVVGDRRIHVVEGVARLDRHVLVGTRVGDACVFLLQPDATRRVHRLDRELEGAAVRLRGSGLRRSRRSPNLPQAARAPGPIARCPRACRAAGPACSGTRPCALPGRRAALPASSRPPGCSDRTAGCRRRAVLPAGSPPSPSARRREPADAAPARRSHWLP